MRIVFYTLIFVSIAPLCHAYVSRANLPFLEEVVEGMSLEELEARRSEIQHQLGSLARFAMNSGVGRIGYRSVAHESADVEEWIEIDFGRTVTLDLIHLVPAIWRDAEKGFIEDGFPLQFEITAGIKGSSGSSTVAHFESTDDIIPRIAPLAIDGKGIKASWIRVTANRLSPRKFDGLYALQFSEIMVFEGARNVALGRKVRTSSSFNYGSGAWSEEFLVDGFLPYLMDSAGGNGSVAYVSAGRLNAPPQLFMDLGRPYMLERLVLHAVEQTDTVPQAFPGDFGVPYEFVIEGSIEPDFTEPVTLLRHERNSVMDVGPIMHLDLNPAEARYLRFTAVEPYIFSYVNEEGLLIRGSRLGFAEIEVHSEGRNVAESKDILSQFDPDNPVRQVEALVDGKNLYGRILPLREWIDQLAMRHDLESEMPYVTVELQHKYTLQKRILYLMKIALVMLAILVIVAIFLYRFRQQRLLFNTRERITADLHDVLGGNISAIALLGQLATREIDNPRELPGYMKRITNLAARTRNALKYISDMLSQPGLYENLEAEMKRIATGLTEGLEHDLEISGREFISEIDQKDRVDIFLFYKECLVNIIRHSRATRVITRLRIDAHALVLEVVDNGTGMPGRGVVEVPDSLRRRARILGGRVSADCPAFCGTEIRLFFKWNRSWLDKLLNLPFALRNP